MKILIADDDPVARRRVEASLQQWGFEVVVAKDGAEAWRMLQMESPPRLAILDWMMPGMDGAQVCQEVRKLEGRPYSYLILLTGKDQQDDIVEGLHAGADEYLCKPFNPSELRARIRTGCRILELEERLIATSEALRVQATHDPLTGLWNRAAILDILRRELARSKRERSPVSVVIADVDHFKHINDTLGHLAGDSVLRQVTARMQSVMRPYDALGRYGGEEFLVIAPGSDQDGAHGLAERLRSSVCDSPLPVSEGVISVTISLGVVATQGLEEVETLIRAADDALYRAKERGRNRVELASPDAGQKMEDVLVERMD
jgi:two-component system cell cycle response regulator